MFGSFIKLVKAFNKKRNETSLINALRISYKYITDRKSLYPKGNFNYTHTSRNMNLRPLVSLIVVSYNSGIDLKNLVDSINNQTYRNIELIMIENGNENSEIYLSHLDFPYKYISSLNIGFAAGNNLAFDKSKGDYICLVNPDTILDEWVIERLLESQLIDSDVAVSVPKIVFYEKFMDIEINSNDQFSLNLFALNNSLNYKKFFIRHGKKQKKNCDQIVDSQNNIIRISLPIDDSKACLKLIKNKGEQNFVVKINESIIKDDSLCRIVDKKDILTLTLNCDKKKIWWGKNLINNAGSDLNQNKPFDIGFGEYDFGMPYDLPKNVRAFCGCVAMISPKVFIQRKIFIDEFFAYFEDSELSSWVIKRNLSIKYNPLAVVRHKHSASSEEGSDVWNTLVSRSSKIYKYLTLNSNKKLEKQSINFDYSSVPSKLQNILKNYDQSLVGKTREDLFEKSKPSIGIYNSYWNTMGGGEKHALSVAKLFSNSHEIYLISETDFDEKKLKSYFSINFKFRKFISVEINSRITSMFNIFVNSTYNSSLISYCAKSLYLVSFPHKNSDKRFINNYFFLHNSTYTKDWALKYWGDHQNSILYPIIGIRSFSERINNDKNNLRNGKRNFISIGRFTKRGHAKRQDFILRAFMEAQKRNKSNFNLFLIGSLDISSKDDLDYFKALDEYKRDNIYLFPNLQFSKLIEILSISKIYIQATGVEIDSRQYPEKLEHFGISVIEALSFGNYPLVYYEGGPAETVKKLKVGETFESFDSLVDIITRIMSDFSLEKYSISDDFLTPFLRVNDESLKLLNQFTELK